MAADASGLSSSSETPRCCRMRRLLLRLRPRRQPSPVYESSVGSICHTSESDSLSEEDVPSGRKYGQKVWWNGLQQHEQQQRRRRQRQRRAPPQWKQRPNSHRGRQKDQFHIGPRSSNAREVGHRDVGRIFDSFSDQQDRNRHWSVIYKDGKMMEVPVQRWPRINYHMNPERRYRNGLPYRAMYGVRYSQRKFEQEEARCHSKTKKTLPAVLLPRRMITASARGQLPYFRRGEPWEQTDRWPTPKVVRVDFRETFLHLHSLHLELAAKRANPPDSTETAEASTKETEKSEQSVQSTDNPNNRRRPKPKGKQKSSF